MPIDRNREQDFAYEIDILLGDARALDRKLKALHVAPSMQEKLNAALMTVTTYLNNLSKHAHNNLRR